MEDILALANPDPEFEQAVKEFGPLPLLLGDIQQIRAIVDSMVPPSSGIQGVTTEDITIPARDGYKIPGRIYKPTTPAKDGSPLFVPFHGGGFCLGSLEGEEFMCGLFVQNFGCICVNVSYRLAPEHPFPAAPNDCWDTVKWVRCGLFECLLTVPAPFEVK